MMELSTAMRLGSMALPPVYGPVFKTDERGEVCGACAVGAALYAVGWLERGSTLTSSDLFPLFQMDARHPISGHTLDVWTIVVDLFECRQWSRELIADWLEEVEQEQDAAQSSEVVMAVENCG